LNNTLNEIPAVLRKKPIITTLIGVGCFAVGTILSLLTRDKTTFTLSIAVLVACLLRAFGLYRTISKTAYTVIDGTCAANTANLIRRTRNVVVIDDSGTSHKLTVPKATRLKVGQRYRFYLAHGSDAVGVQQAEHFLGFEELFDAPTEERAYIVQLPIDKHDI